MQSDNENRKELDAVCQNCGALNKKILKNKEGIGKPLANCVSCGAEFLFSGVSEWEFLSPAMQVFVFLKPIFLAGLTVIGLLIFSFFVPILELIELALGLVTSFLPRSVEGIIFIIGFLTIPVFIFIRKLIPVYKLVRESLIRTQSNRAYRQKLESFIGKNKIQSVGEGFPIFVARNNQNLGQFNENQVAEMLRKNEFLPTDLGVRQGHQHWQPLGILLPNNYPRYQPTLSRGILHPLVAFVIAVGILNLPTAFMLGAFVIDSFIKKPEKVANISTTPTPTTPAITPLPTFDSNKYKEMLDKKDELFKLLPPVKIEVKPTIKAKVLVIEKLNAENDAKSEIVSKYSVVKYGIKSEQIAENLDDLQTLILIKCSAGKEIGQFGPRTAYYSAYASVCNVSIIDYKAKQTIAKKTFVNANRPKTIPDNGYNFINESPTDEINKYLSELKKE